MRQGLAVYQWCPWPFSSVGSLVSLLIGDLESLDLAGIVVDRLAKVIDFLVGGAP